MNPFVYRHRPRSTSRHLFRVLLLALVMSGAPYVGGQVVSARQETPPSYTLVELGSVKNYPWGQPFAVNANGVIVGMASNPDDFTTRATIARDGKVRAMIKGEKGVSAAYDINANGQVIGMSAPSSEDPTVATLWDGDATTVLTEPSDQRAEAMAINDDGLVVGYFDIAEPEGASHAFAWSDGALVTLETLPDGEKNQAIGVNNIGEIVGSSAYYVGEDETRTLIERAVIWRDGEITDLGTLGGENSRAVDINDKGQIVGQSTTAEGQSLDYFGTQAVLWEEDNAIDLGGLDTGRASLASAINAEGHIVGTSIIVDDEGFFVSRATLWHNGAVYDLNDLVSNLPEGWILEGATDINDAGVIVGVVRNADMVSVSFLLTPED